MLTKENITHSKLSTQTYNKLGMSYSEEYIRKSLNFICQNSASINGNRCNRFYDSQAYRIVSEKGSTII